MSVPKILIDLERLRYPNTGLANVFSNIAKGIENIHSIPFEVYYYGVKNELYKISKQLNVQEYKKWHKYFECFSHKYDLIHTSHQHSRYFTKKYNKTIKVLTLHDLNFLYENISTKKRNSLLKKTNKNLQYADYVVCISDFVKNDVLRNQNILHLNNVKEILVIHNGIQLPEEKEYSLGRFTQFKNKKYILNIGVLLPKKNQLSLIRMLPYIDEDLVLVSSNKMNSYLSEINDFIQKFDLKNRIHFLHHVSEEEKYALIQNAQALCHPSLAEGFGIPPIEAMAFGKPVFLSNLTSLPEIGGEHAFYFNSFETQEMVQTFKKGMEIYWQNPEMYGQKLKDWAKQFDYQVMAKNYLDLYAKILAEKQQT